MDAMTTSMCNQGIGRLGYARVLVEVNADKVLANHIDVMYRNSENGEKFMKMVRVEYDWKPPMCSQCKVFGHADNRCPQMVNKNEQNQNTVKDNEGMGIGRWNHKNSFTEKRKKDEANMVDDLGKKCNDDTYKTPTKKIWNVEDSVIKDIRRSANKFAVLQESNDDPLSDKLSKEEKEEVEKSVKIKMQPSYSATKQWTTKMRGYFKKK
ncbi:RNA-directed DNA polymerase, eukaryota, reverse transcriptase zinc-binding domain protein [Tanacetum coccineum]